MALNDYVSNYPGWQNAAKASNKAERDFQAAQTAAEAIPSSNKAAFDAAIAKLNALKATRDAAKAKVDTIVSEATQKYNEKAGKSTLAKAQSDFDFIDSQIKRLEALGKPVPANFTKQKTDAQNKLIATPGYKAPQSTPVDGQTPPKSKAKGEVIAGQGKPQVSIDSTNKVISNKGALNETGGNVQGPATGNSAASLEKERQTMRLAVDNVNSLESIANVRADAGSGAFANWASAQIGKWQTTPASDSRFNSKWEEIQVLLRETKRSKGNGPLGLVDTADLTGLQTAFKEAKSSGVYLDVLLGQDYAYKAAKGLTASSGGGVTKTLVSALKLLDAGDASDKLSKAYYKAYGKYPSQKQITNFKDQWNQEAKNQLSQTASYRSKGMSKDITTGEGFTDAEQSDFLNRYLVKNLKMDAANLGGDTKKIYDEIRSVYRDNFLPEPEFAQVAGVVKDLIGTADANVYNTKIAKVKETVGKQAAAFYPSISEALLNGDSVETYASVYRNSLAKKWGVSAESLKYDNEAQDLIKSAVNFKTSDNKMRLMDNNEFNGLIQSTKRWKASEEAFTSYSNIGDKLINAFNLQAGVK
jgi:hypothetical protein